MPVNLIECPPLEAIEHAIWESDVCIGQWAFCASLTMLRKALDLWSGLYRDQHNMTFARGERDNLYWRLRKIADANPLYRDSIHEVMDSLRIDANDAVHNAFVCAGGRPGTYDGPAIVAIRDPYIELQGRVMYLISSTTPGWTPMMSDKNRWRDRPRQ